MSGEAIDSLPYYDREVEEDPALKQRVEREIAKELSSINTGSLDNVPPSPELFSSSEMLQAAYARISNGVPSTAPEDGIQLAKYNVIIPDTENEDAWKAALNDASTTLEHQHLRATNVELLNKFGSNSWRISNFLLEKDIERIQKDVEDTKLRAEQVNRQRKQAQTDAGEQLSSLETRWTNLVSANLQLEIANIQVEAEAEALRAHKAELEARLQAIAS